MTCTDHDTRSADTSSRCWRGSYDMALVEMIGARAEDGEVLTTIWDYGNIWPGGRFGCDGSDDGPKLMPLPGERLQCLN